MKRIFFVHSLVERFRSENPPKVTYRTTKKQGTYYIATGSWYNAIHEGIVIQVNNNEPVNPASLTDEDARLAGIESREELLSLFRKWYHKLPEIMYRNWISTVWVTPPPLEA